MHVNADQQPTTIQLIVAAQDGHPDALHALLVRAQPDMTRFARTVCATPEDAEDAVQEALWIAAQRIGSIRVASAFTAWLFQVVKHECFRLWRRVRRQESLASWTQAGHGTPTPDHTVLVQDVAMALAALPPRDRQVVVLRDVAGMTAPEVAATLGITLATVKSRLHRARVRMRVALQPWNPTTHDGDASGR